MKGRLLVEGNMSLKRKVLAGGKSSSKVKKRQSGTESCEVEVVLVVGKVCGKRRVEKKGDKDEPRKKTKR